MQELPIAAPVVVRLTGMSSVNPSELRSMLLALVLLIVIVSRLDPPVLMLVGANDLLMVTAGAITCVCALVQLYVVALQLGPGTPGVLLPFGLVDA